MEYINQTTDPIVLILSDYPIKSRIYHQICQSTLHGYTIQSSSAITRTDNEKASLVIVDLNIMHEHEEALRATLCRTYPNADILLLEEDHEDFTFEPHGQHTLIRLGKRADLECVRKILCTHKNWRLGQTTPYRRRVMDLTFTA